MRNESRVIEVSNYEHRVMMEALADRRNDFISENKPAEDVSERQGYPAEDRRCLPSAEVCYGGRNVPDD